MDIVGNQGCSNDARKNIAIGLKINLHPKQCEWWQIICFWAWSEANTLGRTHCPHVLFLPPIRLTAILSVRQASSFNNAERRCFKYMNPVFSAPHIEMFTSSAFIIGLKAPNDATLLVGCYSSSRMIPRCYLSPWVLLEPMGALWS